jgi:hypothetical protein
MKELTIKEQMAISGGDFWSGAQYGATVSTLAIFALKVIGCGSPVTTYKEMATYLGIVAVGTFVGGISGSFSE